MILRMNDKRFLQELSDLLTRYDTQFELEMDSTRSCWYVQAVTPDNEIDLGSVVTGESVQKVIDDHQERLDKAGQRLVDNIFGQKKLVECPECGEQVEEDLAGHSPNAAGLSYSCGHTVWWEYVGGVKVKTVYFNGEIT